MFTVVLTSYKLLIIAAVAAAAAAVAAVVVAVLMMLMNLTRIWLSLDICEKHTNIISHT